MVTTYSPGSITSQTGFPPVTIVGSGAVFSDDDDSTYVQYAGTGSSVGGAATATMPSLAPVVTHISCRIRLQTLGPATAVFVDLEHATNAAEWFSDLSGSDFNSPGWLTIPDITAGAYDPDSFAVSTTFFAFAGNITTTPSLRIFEVRFDVTTPSAHTRRKYPNPTGQGVGPTRHWPRPRRGVTGIN